MAQGFGYNPYFHKDEDDEIDSGFGRYQEDVEHSQNLVIHGFEDDFTDPVQFGPNYQEVPHEEHQFIAREESPVPQQFSQYENLNQWEYDEENRVEYQESVHQQESSKQMQQSEDQDYQVEYPQYPDNEFLIHQQMQNVVQQHQPTEEDEFQVPTQARANHPEVPHEEHQLVAREESPVSQQFLQYEEVAQWDYYETDNQVENQESPHQQEPSQQIQQLEDQDYQVEYPQYRDKGLLNHQQMPHVVQQQQPRQSHQMMPAPVCQMEHQVDDLSTTQVRPQQQRVQTVQQVNQQHQHEMDLFDAPQPQVQKTGPLFFSPLEHPLNGVSKWKNQERNQTVSKPGPPQHSQPMKQPMTSQVNGMSYQVVQQIAHQARPQQQKVSRVQPVNSQPSHFQNEMDSFTQSTLQNKEPNFQGQETSPLVFSPLQHPLNGVLKWAPVYPQAPLQKNAHNVQEQRSAPLKFSPMLHPITKAPVVINQQITQQTHHQVAVHLTQRVEEMEEPSQITENPRSRWHRLTQEEKKRSNIKRTENRQKKRIRDAQKAQEEKEKQENDALRKLNCLKKLWPL
ncbi:hypothetical protein CAEBREN_14067 [Caenorhabditis brenneri]|uniref:Uncharacterized protein n=1 Tax=Caenorhabditis brenneri TaxID=135651 RepID=G0MME8_CAEBE|nr:hypothetical protein CAEBREN_14067 [Caenorhabditis brenneri]